jgi:lipopolysaccharide export system protein LptC
MRPALQGFALRAQQRLEGGAKAAILTSPAAWIAAAWPSTAPGNLRSRRVALLKRLLPAIGVALLLLIAMWPRLAPLWDRMRLAFPAIDLREARELRMVNPHYAGVDRLGRPFLVTAAAGRQVPDRQDLMSMEVPRAEMEIHRDVKIVVTAATGAYQSTAQLLDLFGEVTLVHQNGTRFVTDTARVDVANGTAEGSDPVVGDGPSGDVKAAGFQILGKGETIIFTGKSDILLKGAAPGTAKRAPPGLPAPVATLATKVEADAKPVLAAAAPAAKRPAATADSGHARPTQSPPPVTPARGKKS